jgi:PAS domain S-box-containing protein
MTSHRDPPTTSKTHRAFAELCQSRSWADITPNDLADCPSGLRNALGILQHSSSPMFCIWGSDRTLFYNDATASQFQTLVPAIGNGQSLSNAVGQGASTILRCAEQVLATGQPLPPIPIRAEGSPQAGEPQVVWSYSPLWNNQGEVAGVFASGIASAVTRDGRGVDGRPSPPFFDAPDLQQVTDHLPVLLALVDSQQRYRFVNQTYADWFGRPASTLQHKTLQEVLGEQAYTTVRPYVEQALAGQTVTFERQLHCGVGKIRHVEATYVPQQDAAGTVIGFVALVIDIRARKRAEATLQETEERLRVALQNAPITVFNQDRQLRYTWIYKPAFHHQRDIVGKQDADLLAPADADRVTAIKQRVLHTGTGVREEIKVTKAGIDYYFDLTIEPLRNSSGDIVGITGSTIDISPLKRTTLNLQASEERLRLAMEGSQMATWDVDLATGEAIWSERHFHMLGLEPPPDGKASAEQWSQHVHPDDKDWVFEEWQRAQREHRFYRAEYRIIRADNGNTCWLEGLGNFIYDDQGQAVRSIGVLFDINERKQTEIALQDQRNILETILRQAGDAIMVCDAEGHLTFVNREARRLAQLDPEGTSLDIDLLAWGTAYDIEGRVIPLERYCIAKALRGEATSGYESRMVRQDGSYYDILISAAPLWNDHHQIVGAVASFVDITERKRSEQALRDSEERFRDLADNISQFAWMTDPSGWIFWYNQRWFDYTGTTLEHMKGWGWQDVHHPDHVDRVVAQFTRCIEAGEPWEDTFPLRGRDGNYRWFLSRALPIRDKSGNIRRWFGTNTDITERMQAEAALAQREAELSLVTNAVPALIAFVDANQRYRFNNNRYETWLGVSTEDLYGRHLSEAFDPAGYAEVLPYVEQVLAGQEVTYERQLMHKNGSVRDVSVTYVPRFGSTGQVEGFVALVSDISDRKRAEAALRQSEDRLRMAVESAQLGIWDWNLLTNELTWDPGCKRMFGLSEEANVTIDTFFAGLHPDDHDRLVQVVQECLDPATGGNYDVEFRTQGIEDKVERWILAKGQVYFDADRTPLRFTGTVLDISSQKQYEQALMRSEALARSRAEELTAIMETTPAAIWIAHDPRCHNMTANKTAYDLMGLELGSVTTATPANQVDPLPFKRCRHGQEVASHDLPMQKAIGTERVITDEIDFVFPDGTVRTIYGKAVPLFGPDDRVRGAIGGFVDITALKQSEQERERLLQLERQARQEAENTSRIKDEFLAILSHELRSPLNPILGWVTLLRRGQLSAAKTATALETIERNARLQIQLIDDLLDVSRIIRGKLSLTMVPTRLTPTLEAAIETVRLAAEAKHISIKTHFSSDVGPILGDSARLQQVIWNLLSNAIKFTPEGGQVAVCLEQVSGVGEVGEVGGVGEVGDSASTSPTPLTSPTSPTSSQYAQITVTDTGKGIPPEFLPHVFEYFRQADSSTTRAFGGLGLGLAIVRYLVELHGGTVQASSPGEGQGATFSVRFPILNHHRQHEETTPVPTPVSNPKDLQGISILLVDDDPDTRNFLAAMLSQQGAIVATAASAQEGLQTLSKQSFHILLSDIAMPDIDGYTLIRQIRQGMAGQTRNIPAIALTAYAAETDRNKALAAGFHRHIPKPVSMPDLTEGILELTRMKGSSS